MKTRGWIVGALVAGGVVFAMRGCLTKAAPDERLAGRLQAVCEIARDNVDTPEAGVRALGRYMGKHVDDLLAEWGGTFAAIETIADDRAHDERARLARDRLRPVIRACAADWGRFNQAVADDPAALALLERFNERLSRTIEIVLGAKLDLHGHGLQELPGRFDAMIDQLR